ncbi:MAG: hypothetical protein HOP96_04900 [Sphingomonas sp.]|nr:hypothetical protein [Sphingomonas sp.]
MTSFALAIATKGDWDPDKLLEALGAAGVGPPTEVHVACDPGHAPATSLRGFTIHVREGASLFDLWGLAIDASNADWVAILHADALPVPGWFAAMKGAIEREGWKDGYWGPVEPAFEGSDDRSIGYLTEYVQFHRPIDPKTKEVPGSNLVLPRSRIRRGAGFSKTRLLDEGLAPKFIGEAVVQYSRPFDFRDYCERRYRHGRSYAAKRTPRRSRLVTVPMSFVLPFVRTARIVRQSWRHRHLRRAMLRWIPVILLAETFWSAGELAGYVTGRSGNVSEID